MLTNIEGGRHGGGGGTLRKLNDVDVLENLNGTWTT